VGPRSGLDVVENRKFFTLPGLELLLLGRPARTDCAIPVPRLHYGDISITFSLFTLPKSMGLLATLEAQGTEKSSRQHSVCTRDTPLDLMRGLNGGCYIHTRINIFTQREDN
jgi:hypothetical protein